MAICTNCGAIDNDGGHVCQQGADQSRQPHQFIIPSPDGTLYRVTVTVANGGTPSLESEAV